MNDRKYTAENNEKMESGITQDISQAELVTESQEQGEGSQVDLPEQMPLLAVRDIVIFNYMILPLFVGRNKSIQAIEAALNEKRYILVNTQKDEKVEEPGV
ncbi:MAG: LON peptidase substrate-binding domain-containing protein, partial [Desulfohalobiaceae bacterium]